MPDESPLSLESATSLMMAPATPAATTVATDAPATEPEKTAPTGQEASTTDTAAAQATADTAAADTTTEAAAATDDTAQGGAPATEDGQAEPGSLPPIEPPSGWDTEGKDVFKSLPRKAQEEIARRERDRTNELRNVQNTTAEQRKAAEGEVARLKGLSDRIDGVIKDHVNDLARDFPEIKTQADIEALAASDPSRFAKFQAGLMRFNAANQAAAEAQQALGQKQQQAQQENLAQARTALLETFPTWKDTTVLRKEMTEIQDYAISAGLPEADARMAIHPVLYKIAHKAMLYERAQAQLKQSQDRRPAPQVKPGTTATTKADRDAVNQSAALRKLGQTGAIEDALSLMFTR